jgi:hypothetical protein
MRARAAYLHAAYDKAFWHVIESRVPRLACFSVLRASDLFPSSLAEQQEPLSANYTCPRPQAINHALHLSRSVSCSGCLLQCNVRITRCSRDTGGSCHRNLGLVLGPARQAFRHCGRRVAGTPASRRCSRPCTKLCCVPAMGMPHWPQSRAPHGMHAGAL